MDELKHLALVQDESVLQNELYQLIQQLGAAGVANRTTRATLSAIFENIYGKKPGSMYKTKEDIVRQLHSRFSTMKRAQAFRNI